MDIYENCHLCPRSCGVNRNEKKGFCGAGAKILTAKAMLHQWEEPCISYKNGAGTVFFSGCSLHCCYCQNNIISNELFGKELTHRQLADVFLRLQDMGADNIELVTPTHFVPDIIKSLDIIKHKISIPIIYNSGGYELPETIKMLDSYIDIYMPDIKYFSPEVSSRYSNAPDYFKYTSSAVLAMTAQTGKNIFNEHGGLIKGVLIRHLVLPNQRHDSMKILDWIAENIPNALVSIMNQYTPFEFINDTYSEIKRNVTKMEYNSVIRYAEKLGINGYIQQKSSADEKYVPDFDLSGL
ncbi:MAG: radical SAM protein [Muribaculaceae bacterium]|nr:radical SAM protein [Alistipes senegalensis]MCM1473688.1 radical SAM protein [Muribaculaceae bacterium]